MLRAVVKEMPEYSALMWDLNRHPSRLLFWEHELSSKWCFQQGDLLGLLAFCLTVAPLVESLSSRFNLWYQDDATLGEMADKVFHCLNLNFGKCKAFFLLGTENEQHETGNGLKHMCPSVHVVAADQLELLGSLLTERAISSMFGKNASELTLMAGRLEFLPKLCFYCSIVPC